MATRNRDIRAQRNARQAQRHPTEELGPDYEDEHDIEHYQARDQRDYEQWAQQQTGQQ